MGVFGLISEAAESGFVEKLTEINSAINDFAWIKLGLVLLLGAGVLLTVCTKFFQVVHIKEWWMKTIGGMFSRKSKVRKNKEEGSVSQFQALCTALAATIGTGNIAGVASAICIGGPGAVFWMWTAAFFGMMTNYSENILGLYFRRKNKEGEWSGGPMYYLRDGLGGYKGCKWVGRVLAVLFCICAILASFGIGNMGQINKIVINLDNAFMSNVDLGYAFGNVKWTSVIIGGALMIVGGLIILGGLKRIAAFAEKVVPFMAIAYVVGCIVVFCVHIDKIGAMFAAIFKFAFTPAAVIGGGAGVLIKTMVQGFKRGVFSNEAGLGSSVMVHSASNVREPVKQGMWGIFEVFADTFVVCTMTAIVVLSSGKIDLETGAVNIAEGGDATLVADAFSNVFGPAGGIFVSIAILLFAFTTVVGWSHYGSKAFEYLFGVKAAKFYKVFFVLMIISGALMTSSLAWDISDTFNGLMMIPNLIGVIACLPVVIKLTKNYVDRRIKHKDVEPMLSFDPAIQAEHAKDVEEEMREETEEISASVNSK